MLLLFISIVNLIHALFFLFLSFKNIQFVNKGLDERQSLIRGSNSQLVYSLVLFLTVFYLLGAKFLENYLTISFVANSYLAIPMGCEIIANTLDGVDFTTEIDKKIQYVMSLLGFVGLVLLTSVVYALVFASGVVTYGEALTNIIWGVFDIAICSAFFYRKHQDGLEEEEEDE